MQGPQVLIVRTNDFHEITKNLILKRKNVARVRKLKTIDQENMKIFQNLSSIKSHLSTLKLPKYEIIKKVPISQLQDNNSRGGLMMMSMSPIIEKPAV